MMKHLCVDIGNTSIKLCLFSGFRRAKVHEIPTSAVKSCGRILRTKFSGVIIDESIICSVVPAAERIIAPMIKKHTKKRHYCVGKNCFIRIPSAYQKGALGADRLVALWGALWKWKSPLIIVSFGTAITIDYINKAGKHCGGFIVPGLSAATQALSNNTAQLPPVRFKKDSAGCGTDTRTCIQRGIVQGTAYAVDGFVAQIKKKYGIAPVVIGIGGQARFMKRSCRSISYTDQYHVLESLNMVLMALAGR